MLQCVHESCSAYAMEYTKPSQTFFDMYSLEVRAHTGDESVLRAVDSLLRLLVEKNSINRSLTADLAYPTHMYS